MLIEGLRRVSDASKTLVILCLVAMLVASSLASPREASAALYGPEVPSPPGQVYVLTVNAQQQLAVDLKAFRRLFELVKAMRARPIAFDGGFSNATGMPDVIIFNEIRYANLEILRRLLEQRSRFDYEIVAAEGAQTKFLANTSELTLQGAPQTIVDPCRSGDENSPPKMYQAARFTENATGAPLTVVGVHLKARYDQTDECRARNIQAIKTAVAADVGPIVIGGDFNARPVVEQAACDPEEHSASADWYLMMTEPQDLSRAFTDAVRSSHAARSKSMATEWTFERNTTVGLCDGSFGHRRSRLDYLFSDGATVAEAHADHPGWAIEESPGAVPLGRARYSDHRWVQGRFVLTAAERPARPGADLAAGGTVNLEWSLVNGATTYVVYRATRRRGFEQIGTVTSEQTTFTDTADHGVPYRYAIAAQTAEGAQGLESPGRRVIPDARGPRVTANYPSRDATNAPVYKRIRVWFDERVNPLSVTSSTIAVYRKGVRVRGTVEQESRRQISFNPRSNLRKGVRHTVVVRRVTDRLGNVGSRYSFSFTTKPPPPPPEKKRRR